MKLRVKFCAEDLHRSYCRYCQTKLLFWCIFDGTNIHRTAIYRKTFITFLAVTCVKKTLCIVISITIFHLSVAATGGVLLEKLYLEILQNSLEKTCGKVSFFNEVAGIGDCFWSFSCLLFISNLFHFNRKMKWKQGKYPDGVQIFTFLLEYRFVWRQRFQKKFDRWQFDRKMCLMGIWCCSFHG